MSARQLFESMQPACAVAKPVVYRDKVVKGGVVVCPHCEQEIHEKAIGCVEGDLQQTIHRACGGRIQLRPMSERERAWLEKFTGKRLGESIDAAYTPDVLAMIHSPAGKRLLASLGCKFENGRIIDRARAEYLDSEGWHPSEHHQP